MLNYFTANFSDLAKGIDSKSSPNLISDGYSVSLQNVNTNIEGHLQKRKGYQGYYGYVPLRVNSVEYTNDVTDNIIFTLDGAINLSSLTVSPVIVYGDLANTTMDGDFVSSSSNHKYYSSYTLDNTSTLAAGTGLTITKTPGETGVASDAIAVNLAEDTGPDQSNSLFFPDNVNTTASSYQVDIDYTNLTGSPITSYLYFLDKSPVIGSVSHHSFTSVAVISIPAATHGLTNFNISPIVQELVAGVYTNIIPDSFVISSTGDVTVTLSAATTGRVILSSVGVSSTTSGTISASSPGILPIASPTTPFSFVSCYIENGTDLEQVYPDSVVYDSVTNKINVSIVNNTAIDKTFHVYYEFANLIANSLKVTGTVTVTGTDNEPQLTLWGISHSGIYNLTATKGGHVNHIDSYKRVGEQRLVCGMAGNVFRTLTSAEIGATACPKVYIDLRNRISTKSKLAPLFQTTSAAVGRTKGTIEADNISGNKAVITNAAGSAGQMTYTLNVTNRAFLDANGNPVGILDVLSITSGLEDWLVVTSMTKEVLNGTFKIVSATNVDINTITITVANSAIISTDYDESSAIGLAQIMTDRIVMSNSSTFAADDILSSEVLISADNITVSSSSASTIVVSGVTREIDFPSGVRLYGKRTSTTFPIRNVISTATVTFLVKGDMLSITDFPQRLRINSIDVGANTITLDESVTLEDNAASSVEIQPVGRWYTIEIPSSSGDLLNTTKTTMFDSLPSYSQATLRSNIIADNMYFVNNTDEVMKFDGTNAYRAGLPKWKPNLFATVDTATTSFTLITTSASKTSNRVFTVTAGDGALFSAGDKVYYAADTKIFVVQEVAADTITVTENITAAGPAVLNIVQEYSYAFQIKAIDANNNVVASAYAGSQDFKVQVTQNGQINIKLVGMPAWDIYDFDRISLSVLRTLDGLAKPFYLIRTIDVPFGKYNGYISVVDGIIDDTLTAKDLDSVASALFGENAPTGWQEPLRASYVTTASNRLLLANVKGYPKFNIVISEKATGSKISTADLLAAGETRWLFRKDSTDTDVSTDMINRVAYEFVDAAAGTTINPATAISSPAADTVRITVANTFAANDWVYLFHASTGTDLTFAGWYQVINATVTYFDFNDSNARAGTATDTDTFISAAAPTDIPVVIGTDSNYTIRDGSPDSSKSYSTTAAIRLANAINASMRVTNKDLVSSFEPWITAEAGSELGSGRLVVRQAKVLSTTPELALDSAAGTSYQIFVNEVLRDAIRPAGTVTSVFPSRLLISYENYPEIFDDPEGTGTSILDINSADGQDITGVIPFFADSSFGNAQKEATVVVFKTDSIYVADVIRGEIQKLDSKGLGCTFPYSITPTRNGIMFANRSGVYKLNYNLTLEYAGRKVEKIWTEELNLADTAAITGHSYALTQRYELSVPLIGSSTNSDVLVYDQNRETTQALGAWTRYTNFNTTGWANLGNTSLFASTIGEVFSIRDAGTDSDYRDDAGAISMIIVTRPFSLGTPGIRHKLRSIISNFKVVSDMLGTSLSTAVNLSSTFTATDSFTIDTASSSTDFNDRDVVTMRHSVKNQKFVFVQLKYTNSTKDEEFVLAGIIFSAAPLQAKGIEQAGTVDK